MKIFIKHILRNLKENKKRTFLIMLSLIFTGMFISIIISAINLVFNLEHVIVDEITANFDYIITNKDGSPITKLQEETVLNGTTKVGLFDDYGYITIGDKDYLMDIYGADTTISYKAGIFRDNNTGIELKENEIIVSEDELTYLKLNVGDKIVFYNSKGHPYELVIAKAIKNDFYLQYDKGKRYTFATNLETYKKITENNELENYEYYISFNKKLNEKERQQFEKKCDEIGIKVTEKPATVNIASMFDMVVPILIVVVLLLAVIVYFVNNSFVKIILNERIPTMGTFRSVGATSKEIDKILLLEMALYGFISGVIGSVIGFLISRLLIKSILVPLFEDTMAGYDFNFLLRTIDNSAISILLISIICITVFQVLLSVKDIYASNKISIKDCIFNKYNDIQIYEEKNLMYGLTFLVIGIIGIAFKNKLNTFWGVIALVLLFISISKLLPYIYRLIFQRIKIKNPVYKMASSNVYHSKLQMGSSIILCILLSIIILLISFANELKEENLDVGSKYSFDSYVSIVSASDEDINDISYVNGVESIATLYNALPISDEKYIANNKVSNFMFLATDNAETLLKTNKAYFGTDVTTLKNMAKNEIIISSDDAKKYGINIGDYIYLNNVLKKEKFNVELPIYLKVVGLHDYSSTMAFINIDLMNELNNLGIFAVTKELYIISEKNVDVTANINKLFKERDISDRAKTLPEFIDDIESNTTTAYIVLIIVCIGLSFVVLICLTNNQKISFLQRKKEFATLNSICMSRKQLKKLITIEIMISYLISFLTAIMYSIIILSIVSAIIDMRLKMTLFSIIIIFIIMAIVMYFVSLKIRKNINKINIIDEIKYE